MRCVKIVEKLLIFFLNLKLYWEKIKTGKNNNVKQIKTNCSYPSCTVSYKF